MMLSSFDIKMIVIIVLMVSAMWLVLELCKKDEDNYKERIKKAIERQESRLRHRGNTTRGDNSIEQDDPTSTIIGSSGNSVSRISNKANHVFVCGTTGSGKTVLLSNFIESSIKKNFPLVIIDGKGDLGEGSLLDIVSKLAPKKKVHVINLCDIKRSSKYNPFKDASATVVKDMLISLSDWSEEHYKQNTERYIQRLCFVLEKMEMPLSFETITEYMNIKNLEILNTKGAKDGVFTTEEQLQTLRIIKASGEIAMNASARFVTMFESELGSIFADNGIDIKRAIQKNEIILLVLNPLRYPELSPRIAELVLIDIKNSVSHLYSHQKERVFFLFDEISSYMSDVFLELVNKSRSANVTCVLATQSLSDLERKAGAVYREQVIENCNNYIVLRQNSSVNAEAWANIIGTRPGVAVTYQLGDEDNSLTATGRGSARMTREFHFHPDEIKWLGVGEAIYVSKDTKEIKKIKVRKGDYL